MTIDAALSRVVWVALVAGLISPGTPAGAVDIRDDTYEGRPQFKIVTATATYFFDRGGGGLSRMIDRDGHDWIAFHTDPPITAPAPAFTASAARGIPNSVFRLDDNGASHPGFDQCESTMLDARTVRAVSKSGKWQWTWVFAEDHAIMTVDKVDPSRSYWFLYEGPIAGSFAPARKYWGTDLGGPRHDVPDLIKGKPIHEVWRWAYFGDRDVPRVLFVAQEPADDLVDTFSYMGNNRAAGVESPDGMAVFGFGRAPAAKPLLDKPGLRFFIGFHEGAVAGEKEHRRVAAAIVKIAGNRPSLAIDQSATSAPAAGNQRKGKGSEGTPASIAPPSARSTVGASTDASGPSSFVLFDLEFTHRGNRQLYKNWNFETRRKTNPAAPTNWREGENSVFDAGIYHWRVEVLRMERAWQSPMHVQFGWWNFVGDPVIRHIAAPALLLTHLDPPAPGQPWVYELVGTVRSLDVVNMYYGKGPNQDKKVTDWDWSRAFAPDTAYTLVNPRENKLDADGDGKISEAEYPDLEIHAVLTLHRPGSPDYESLRARLPAPKSSGDRKSAPSGAIAK